MNAERKQPPEAWANAEDGATLTRIKRAEVKEAEKNLKALVGTRKDPGAIEMATQLKVAELREKGLDEAVIAFEAKREIAEQFRPKIQRYLEAMMEATAGRAESLDSIDDDDKRRQMEDFLGRQGNRMVNTVKMAMEAIDLAAQPALPDVNIKISIPAGAGVSAKTGKTAEDDFADYVEGEVVSDESQ